MIDDETDIAIHAITVRMNPVVLEARFSAVRSSSISLDILSSLQCVRNLHVGEYW